MNKNDPELLEAQAEEMLKKLEENVDTSTEQPSEEPAQSSQPTPDESEQPAETVEAPAEEDSPSGELSDSQIALDKANQRYKNAQSKMTKAAQEAADLRRQNEQIQAELEKLKNQSAVAERDTAKIEQIKEDYPDLANPLLDELERTNAEVRQTKQLLEQQRQQQLQQEQQSAQQAHFERIRQVHSDVDSVIESDEWMDWLDVQDTQTKHWVEQGSSNDAIAVLNAFKSDTKISPREQVLEKAKAVAEPRLPKSRKPEGSAQKKVWTLNDVKSLSNEEFEKHEDEIFKAMAKGQIARR